MSKLDNMYGVTMKIETFCVMLKKFQASCITETKIILRAPDKSSQTLSYVYTLSTQLYDIQRDVQTQNCL